MDAFTYTATSRASEPFALPVVKLPSPRKSLLEIKNRQLRGEQSGSGSHGGSASGAGTDQGGHHPSHQTAWVPQKKN